MYLINFLTYDTHLKKDCLKLSSNVLSCSGYQNKKGQRNVPNKYLPLW
jgi:hypothetical protein